MPVCFYRFCLSKGNELRARMGIHYAMMVVSVNADVLYRPPADITKGSSRRL
jgi:hypothetical protein